LVALVYGFSSFCFVSIFLWYEVILLFVDLVSVKLARLSVGGAKQARIGIEDVLSSVEGGKHDYDWYECFIYNYFIQWTNELIEICSFID